MPRVSDQRLSVEVITNAREDGKGRDIRPLLAPRSVLELERAYACQVGYDVWRVAVGGEYYLRLECGDYDRLVIGRRQIVGLHGTSDFNQSQARVHLEAGSHLLKLELHNRQSSGWKRLLVKGPAPYEYRLMEGGGLATIDLGNHRAWIKMVEGLEPACLWAWG
ncbi:hypothetical protein DFAR_2920001 [Desulfarculales bacterium]